MAYFNELPNLEYISPFDDITSNKDYIRTKNIFLRPKLVSGISQFVSSFEDYYIKDGERPDNVAENAYGDPELDWVVLITNNITNLNDQWPLDNASFQKYLLDKYETEENIYSTHHYETTEIKDQFDRSILDKGFIVDEGFTRSFTTEEGSSSYILPAYQDSNLDTTIKINLNQFLQIEGRFEIIVSHKITDINITSSILYLEGRNETYSINISNSLDPWPSGWGGSLPVQLRDGSTLNVDIGDEIGDVYIELPPYLYELEREQVGDQINTTFNFVPQ